MSIFRKYAERLNPLVPTILRRQANNIINLVVQQYNAAQDALAEALIEYIDVSWPITTATGWVLDAHWGPYLDLQRNGQDDTNYRLFIRAKRLLNRSWGSADQALEIFELLLPAASLLFVPQYPKQWVIQIQGVDMAQAAPAIAFMEKKPSPLGGGFSVAGDNGFAVVSDAKVMSFSSTYGPPGVDYQVTGSFSSVYGPSGADEAGWAHVAQI